MAIITKLAFALLVAFLIASVVDAAQAQTLAPSRAAAEAHGAAAGKIGPAGRPLARSGGILR